MYQLKINGHIPEQKYHEFQQSLEEIHEQIQHDCAEFILSHDLNEKTLYTLVIYWKNKEAYESFLLSSDYHILCGSFRALGCIKKIITGEVTDRSQR